MMFTYLNNASKLFGSKISFMLLLLKISEGFTSL